MALAAATFSSTRSSNRSARVAEEALLAQMRPLLVPSAGDDAPRKILWSDLHTVLLPGGRALVDVEGDVIYVAIGLRNVGSGMALLHAWYVIPDRVVTYEDHADPELFRRLS